MTSFYYFPFFGNATFYILIFARLNGRTKMSYNATISNLPFNLFVLTLCDGIIHRIFALWIKIKWKDLLILQYSLCHLLLVKHLSFLFIWFVVILGISNYWSTISWIKMYNELIFNFLTITLQFLLRLHCSGHITCLLYYHKGRAIEDFRRILLD